MPFGCDCGEPCGCFSSPAPPFPFVAASCPSGDLFFSAPSPDCCLFFSAALSPVFLPSAFRFASPPSCPGCCCFCLPLPGCCSGFCADFPSAADSPFDDLPSCCFSSPAVCFLPCCFPGCSLPCCCWPCSCLPFSPSDCSLSFFNSPCCSIRF